jgi:hypothetical protein
MFQILYSFNLISNSFLKINKIIVNIFLVTSLTSTIIIVPLILTYNDNYKFIIPNKYYNEFNDKVISPSYFGLILGL